MTGADGRLKLLVVRASFANLGGAERELLTVMREWSKRWEVTVATLDFPEAAQKLAKGLDVRIISPSQPFTPSSGMIAEITGSASKTAAKAWSGVEGLRQVIAESDVIHLSVCRGSLEILPLIPEGKGIHYHCLEPPRWLHEDVLHRRLDGRLKRPAWLTNLLFSRQRKRDMALVKQLLGRKGAAISGNSHWIQSQISRIYEIPHDPELDNGQPAVRNNGLCGGATVLMHVIDLEDWDLKGSAKSPKTPEKYVVTIGRISHVKGTWQTLHSLEGTGIGLVQVGGGDAKDVRILQKEADRIGIELVCMPRLDQKQLRSLVKGAVAMVSHAYSEPFGLTPIEAMAVGTPALFVDEGGFHNTMHDADSGMLLSRDADWKAAYQKAEDSEIREKWAKAGRKHVEGHFTLEVQADALQRLLDDCMKHA